MKLKILTLPILFSILFTFSCSSKPDSGPDVYTKKNKAAEYSAYGNTYYESTQYEQALGFFQMALKLNISVNNEEGMVTNYNSIGKTLVSMGNREDGEINFNLAMDLAKRLNNNELLVQSLTYLGELYLRNGLVDKSKPLINQALSISDSLSDDNETISVLYHNAGVLAKYDNNLNLAMEYFQRAAAINNKLEKLSELASNYYMMSSVYSKQEQYETALKFAFLALENDKKTEHSFGIAKDIHAIAIIYYKSEQFQESYDYYKKAYLIYNTLKMKPELIQVLKSLIKLAPEYGSEEDKNTFTADYKLLQGTL